MIESELSSFVMSFFGVSALIGGLEWDAVDGDGGGEARGVIEPFSGGRVLRQVP